MGGRQEMKLPLFGKEGRGEIIGEIFIGKFGTPNDGWQSRAEILYTFKISMKTAFLCFIVCLCLLLRFQGAYAASDIEMEVLAFPEKTERYEDIPVLIRITNNGDTPLKECIDPESSDGCVAVGWHIADKPGWTIAMTGVFSPLTDAKRLGPHESVERTLRMPVGKLKGDIYPTIYLVKKNGDAVELKRRQLKVNVQKASPGVRARRHAVRSLALGYFAIVLFSAIAIWRKRR